MDDRKLPFTIHLQELRKRLRNAGIAFILAVIVCFYFAEAIYALLAVPLQEAYRSIPEVEYQGLKFGSPLEPFWVFFELALWGGLFVSSPVIFHQLWKFIAPGLYDK